MHFFKKDFSFYDIHLFLKFKIPLQGIMYYHTGIYQYCTIVFILYILYILYILLLVKV